MAVLGSSARYRLVVGAILATLLTAALAAAPVGAVGSAEHAGPVTTHELDPAEPDGADGWYRSPVEVTLHAVGATAPIERTEYRINNGEWQTYGNAEEVIFDGTRESFARWRQAGPGEFVLLPDGSILSLGGLGMLWYPEEYGDIAVRMEWRDLRPSVTGASNSGVFVRFPDPDEAAARQAEDRYACQVGSGESQPAWVAINCGHEIQIYDGDTGEPQKTGSIYNFAPLDLEQARPNTQGDWTDYEIRTVGEGDYEVTVVRDGETIQQWVNTPGQQASRGGDPGTEDRQFARGYIGLQNHGPFDFIAFRDVRVQHLGAPIRIDAPGQHTIDYRSVDQDGNVEQMRSVTVRYDPEAPTTTATVDGGASGPATVALTARDHERGSGVQHTEYRVNGGEWQTAVAPEEAIFDGTQASLDRWRMAGPGSFELTGDGSMRTTGGMGMLWYPEQRYGDIALSMEWRDVREGDGYSNSGVFVRFPDPDAATSQPPSELHLCQLGLGLWAPEWVAIGCGHEIQIYDGPTGEVQKTGSVYNFAPLDMDQAKATPKGEWNHYEVRTVGDGGYLVTVIRNGAVITEWANTPGQQPARIYDPPTDLRQFATGYIGLQNHGGSDVVEFRDVRVRDLAPRTTITIAEPGAHTVEFRSVDSAGNVERIREIGLTVSG